jgi:glycosyltransferase involved in cell wall biosynthesis
MNNSPDQPLITIAIPTFERTKYLPAALESCFAQSYSNYEIIVHDDTASDAIKSIVESYKSPRIRYFQNKPMLGLVAKLNDFLQKARGEWLVILCDDDAFEPGFLEEMVKLASAHPDASLLRSRNRLIDGTGRELSLDLAWPLLLDSNTFLSRLFLPQSQNITMNLTGMVFRPEKLSAMGGFADLYRAWHVDRLAWAQLGAEGPVVSSPNVLCNIRVHAESITSGNISDYSKSLESDLILKQIVDQLFAARLADTNDEGEREKLRKAELAFSQYVHRHMSRSLDHGFLAALVSRNADKQNDLFAMMNNLNIPSFATARAYRLLRHLPLWIRKIAVKRIYKHKQHWFKHPAPRPDLLP